MPNTSPELFFYCIPLFGLIALGFTFWKSAIFIACVYPACGILFSEFSFLFHIYSSSPRQLSCVGSSLPWVCNDCVVLEARL